MDTLTQRTTKRFKKALAALEAALDLEELPEHANRDAVLLRYASALRSITSRL